jgi:hypothetical protein
MKTKIVKTIDKEGKDLTLVVKTPTPKQVSEAMLYSAKVFRDGVEMGVLPRAKINSYLRDAKLWDDQKEEQLQKILTNLRDAEAQLKRGGRAKDGTPFTIKEARKLALKMKEWRIDYVILMTAYGQLDAKYSIEGIVENAKFDFMVSCCVFTEDQKRVFKNYDHYMEESENEYAIAAATALSELINGSTDDIEKEWPEHKFLLEHGFIRESDFRLVDKDGNLVNVDFKKVDDDGFMVDENGNRVNTDGKKVDDNGQEIIEFTPFAEETD